MDDVKNKQISDKEYDCQAKSFYASSTCFRYVKKLENLHFFDFEDGTVIPYTINDNQASLHVAMRHMSTKQLDAVCTYIFTSESVARIFIDHVYEPYISENLFPVQCGVNSDVLMPIPKTKEEYLKGLGKKTRTHIKYYMTRLSKKFDSVEYLVYSNQSIQREMIEKMMTMNHQRLAHHGKGKDQTTEEEINEVYNCAKEIGHLFCVSINHEIQAFALIQEVGGDYWLTNIGSNEEYDNYNCGQIALFQSICFAIENRKSEENYYHFMFELTDYKKRFGGEMVELYPYFVYRKESISYYLTVLWYSLIVKIQRLIKRNDTVKRIISKLRKLGH